MVRNYPLACEDCHNSKGWELEAGTYSFSHNKTNFPLQGMHQDVNCKNCHPSLVFSQAENECVSCHTDMHSQTVGMDCARCHTPKSWIVENITDIHQQSRFPLVGPHFTADCYDCHPSASLLKFGPLGIECYDCHQQDYATASQPNHIEGNFSTDCAECHSINAFTWSGTGFNHAIFPLTAGHAIDDCKQCHTGNDYSDISSECYSCHQTDYTSTTNPGHLAADISNDCAECHTTNPDWKPAQFIQHDAQFFPVYSGEHGGEWNSCTECHQNSGNYAVFTCIDCHEHNQPEMNDEHQEINGYAYNSIACFECHPTGDAEGSFNHSATNFPLTGAHVSTACEECHPQIYEGTPTFCFDCHTEEFNQSINPNHIEVGIANVCDECHTTEPGWIPASFNNHDEYYALTGAHMEPEVDCFACHEGNYTNTPNECAGCHTNNYNQSTNPSHIELMLAITCEDCHTTNPGWTPATFDEHNEYYPLTGAHTAIPNCYDCHEGSYTNTPNECYGCHADDYNQTNDPPHQSAQFPIDCEACHTTSIWDPSTFDHDGQYFPIYSGEHQGEWDQCSDCHENPSNYAIFTCITCHEQGDMNEEHQGISGYQYNSIACLSCHPDGSSIGAFNHSATNFPLTGAHTTVDCNDCHENGYAGTSTICAECHLEDFTQTTNPNHTQVGISNTCADCHTTDPGWTPAAFEIHNEYYPLTGAHLSMPDCFDCHEGNYSNTPNECAGCHTNNYNQTSNPNHNEVGISMVCVDCHTTDPGWTPATFEVHNEYYPLTGAHLSMPSCFDCHEGNYTNTPNECAGCHTNNYNQTTNPNHNEVGISMVCADCHTADPGWTPAEFEVHNEYFPLTGAHLTMPSCFDCHEGNYTSTPNECAGCHTNNYNQTTNPNHTEAGISLVCADCHTTDPGWTPATFEVHNEFYPLTGAHASIPNCYDCHQGNYTTTPNECYGCHADDYNQTNDPPHQSAQFPVDCESCHTTSVWDPSTFNHDGQYFPIYSGNHNDEWDQCSDCHNNSSNYAIFTCLTCHDENETNNDHDEVSGYQYNSIACLSCHPGGNSDRKIFKKF